MIRAWLMLPVAALVLTACGSAPKAASSHHAAQSLAAVATTTPPAPATTAASRARARRPDLPH